MSEPYAILGKTSDVFVARSVDCLEGIECFDCKLRPKLLRKDLRYCFIAETPRVMFEHLTEHTEAGHKVPPSAMTRLIAEIERGLQ